MSPDRALASLSARGVEVRDLVRQMRRLAEPLPMPIRIEVNNLQEALDFLSHRIREETLRRVIEPVEGGNNHCKGKASARSTRSAK